MGVLLEKGKQLRKNPDFVKKERHIKQKFIKLYGLTFSIM